MSIWDSQYQHSQGRMWPAEELVRFLGRTYGPMPDQKGGGLTALEIGCGAGGNVWALAKWGFFVYAVDRSGVALELTRRRMADEGLYRLVHTQPYTAPESLKLPAASVHLAVDVQTIQHLDEAAHEAMYKEIHRVLVPGGLFFQVHWCSGENAKDIFPSHLELCQWTTDYSIGWYINNIGFTEESYEIASRTYGENLAQWAVSVWRKA